MTYCKRISELEKEREELREELSEVIGVMVPVSVTRSYHKCGNPNCKRCREGEGSHGPFLYMTWKDSDRKTHTFYVNRGLEHLADEAHNGWNRFKEIGKEIGKINREILKLRIKERREKR